MDNATLFKNIHKVIPGHYLIIDLNTMDIQTVKFWEPSFKIDEYHTEAYFKDELRRLIEDTIQIQLRSDVPLGTYLSGGMDSSIVTMTASEKVQNPLKTFTGAFREGKEFDETCYSREIAAACGFCYRNNKSPKNIHFEKKSVERDIYF